jgi:hypothetical protein
MTPKRYPALLRITFANCAPKTSNYGFEPGLLRKAEATSIVQLMSACERLHSAHSLRALLSDLPKQMLLGLHSGLSTSQLHVCT